MVIAPDGRVGWLPAAVELDTDPNNLYTLVLEPVNPPIPNLIFADDFSAEDSRRNDGSSDNFRAGLNNEAYRMEVGNEWSGLQHTTSFDELNTLTDFTASVVLRPTRAYGAGGFLFGGTPNLEVYYEYLVWPAERSYRLRLHDTQGWHDLTGWVVSPAIKKNPERNTPKITVLGNQAALYANDTLLEVVTLSTSGAGRLGFMIQRFPDVEQADAWAIFEFDNLRVTLPEPIPADAPSALCRASVARRVNVRSGPGEDYTVLGGLESGAPLQATGRNGQWVAVEIDGRQGWVAGWIVF